MSSIKFTIRPYHDSDNSSPPDCKISLSEGALVLELENPRRKINLHPTDVKAIKLLLLSSEDSK